MDRFFILSASVWEAVPFRCAAWPPDSVNFLWIAGPTALVCSVMHLGLVWQLVVTAVCHGPFGSLETDSSFNRLRFLANRSCTWVLETAGGGRSLPWAAGSLETVK